MSVVDVAVVGPGAIGCSLTLALEQAGRGPLALCGRTPVPGRVVVVDEDGEEHPLLTPVATDPAALDGPASVVLLAVKAHQTAGAAAWLARLCGPSTLVVALQNGVEQVETIAPLVGGASVLPSVVWLPAEMVAPGRVAARGAVRLTVPAGPDGARFAALLEGSGADVVLAEDFRTIAWHKLTANAVAGLMALAGRRSGMFRSGDVAALARALALECLAVARAEGAHLEDTAADELIGIIAGYPEDLGTSILFDRLAGRRLEWDARNGVVRRRGRTHGIPTPISDVVAPLLAAASGERGG